MQMSERVIGILGGMGPEATADLFLEITRLTPARKDQDHIPVLIFSNSRIPDRTRAILGAGEDPLPALVETAKVLEAGGAGILAMPCNAAHHYVSMIQERIGIPILNMIEETCHTLKRENSDIRSVGLLAATGTIRSGVYDVVCARERMELLVPDDIEQERVHAAIFEVKAGSHSDSTRECFESAGASLVQKGAQAVILGCTEIPLAFNPGKVNYLSVNPTRILAQAAVDWALGKRAWC
jgi:aspartate racemase